MTLKGVRDVVKAPLLKSRTRAHRRDSSQQSASLGSSWDEALIENGKGINVRRDYTVKFEKGEGRREKGMMVCNI